MQYELLIKIIDTLREDNELFDLIASDYGLKELDKKELQCSFLWLIDFARSIHAENKSVVTAREIYILKAFLKLRSFTISDTPIDYFHAPLLPINRACMKLAKALENKDEIACKLLSNENIKIIGEPETTLDDFWDEDGILSLHTLRFNHKKTALLDIEAILHYACVDPRYLFEKEKLGLAQEDLLILENSLGETTQELFSYLKILYEKKNTPDNLGAQLELLTQQLAESSISGKGNEDQAYSAAIANAIKNFHDFWKALPLEIRSPIAKYQVYEHRTLEAYLLFLFDACPGCDKLTKEEKEILSSQAVFNCTSLISQALSDFVNRHKDFYDIKLSRSVGKSEIDSNDDTSKLTQPDTEALQKNIKNSLHLNQYVLRPSESNSRIDEFKLKVFSILSNFLKKPYNRNFYPSIENITNDITSLLYILNIIKNIGFNLSLLSTSIYEKISIILIEEAHRSIATGNHEEYETEKIKIKSNILKILSTIASESFDDFFKNFSFYELRQFEAIINTLFIIIFDSLPTDCERMALVKSVIKQDKQFVKAYIIPNLSKFKEGFKALFFNVLTDEQYLKELDCESFLSILKTLNENQNKVEELEKLIEKYLKYIDSAYKLKNILQFIKNPNKRTSLIKKYHKLIKDRNQLICLLPLTNLEQRYSLIELKGFDLVEHAHAHKALIAKQLFQLLPKDDFSDLLKSTTVLKFVKNGKALISQLLNNLTTNQAFEFVEILGDSIKEIIKNVNELDALLRKLPEEKRFTVYLKFKWNGVPCIESSSFIIANKDLYGHWKGRRYLI